MSKLLLDTNFLIDFVIKERPESDAAAELFGLIVQGKHQGLVCATSFKDMYYLLRKICSDQESREWIKIFGSAFTPLPLDWEACATALVSDEPDFEDGCIRAVAERAGVDFIITRDSKAFARSRVKSYSAQRFLEVFA